MATLKEDIIIGSNWISEALISSGYKADFSMDSLEEIDHFFDEQSKDGDAIPGGLLSEDLGKRLFCIGCYVGEVIRKNYGGEWIVDELDPESEINISLKLPDGGLIWPAQRVIKRFKNGNEDSINVYGHWVMK